jgi:hypothetical protein
MDEKKELSGYNKDDLYRITARIYTTVTEKVPDDNTTQQIRGGIDALVRIAEYDIDLVNALIHAGVRSLPPKITDHLELIDFARTVFPSRYISPGCEIPKCQPCRYRDVNDGK